MRVVREAGELDEAIAAARREAQASFGDPHLLLERYLDAAAERPLDAYLAQRVFADEEFATATPDAADAAGYASYLTRYEAGLAIERAAVAAL